MFIILKQITSLKSYSSQSANENITESDGLCEEAEQMGHPVVLTEPQVSVCGPLCQSVCMRISCPGLSILSLERSS